MSRPSFKLSGPVLDSPNPLALASFYERMLGWAIVASEGSQEGDQPHEEWAVLRSPDGVQKIEIQREPHYSRPVWPPVEGEQLMMMHLDFGTSDLDDGVEWAIAAGATAAAHQPQDDVRVMMDPDGHPFCLFLDAL